MSVALRGSSPVVLTAGILLLSRSRSFGQPIGVHVVGSPEDITPVEGPAIVHSPVLASCGVGRDLGSGSLVIVPGPSCDPLATSLSRDGTGDWFELDRSGEGLDEATRSFVNLSRDPRADVRLLGRDLRRALALVGVVSEPALIDLIFRAPVPPLLRIALGLRAGRAMAGGRCEPVTQFLAQSQAELSDPLPPLSSEQLIDVLTDGRVDTMLHRLPLASRDRVEDWVHAMEHLCREGERDSERILRSLIELASHLCSLPSRSILPPLDPAMDAVAVGLGSALGATRGTRDANLALVDTFRFLGGRFVDSAAYPVDLPSIDPPDSKLERWAWFCRSMKSAADAAESLWRQVVDPVQ